MTILKAMTATMVAGLGALAISATAFAATATTAATATASPTASPTATPTPTPHATPTPTPVAGALTIGLSCDTGRSGSGTFVVTANTKSSSVSVRCGASGAVSNAAWKVGSKATIHQTSAASGALRAADLSVTLKAAAQSVSIRNFRAAVPVAAQTTTLAQTGGGLPLLPIGGALVGLLLAAIGTRLVFARR